MSDIRVRFAPSPTGKVHIGNIRAAIYNWLFARHTGGKFLLRVEDTDLERSTPEAIAVLFDCMKWLGLDWDEEVFYQTKNVKRHLEVVDQLLASGHAYKVEKTSRDGKTGVVTMFRMPKEGVIEFDDIVKGHMAKKAEDIQDFAIVRSDGSPIFHIANVVDDIDQRVTHIIRGDDHVENTFKHICIFRALGAEVPKYGHLSMIVNQQGKPYSKRDGAAFVGEYREQGYLPEALFNYLLLLGWNPGDDREVLTREEMIRLFELEKVHVTAAMFDPKKLAWMNGEYIKKIPANEFRAPPRGASANTPYPLARTFAPPPNIAPTKLRRPTATLARRRRPKAPPRGTSANTPYPLARTFAPPPTCRTPTMLCRFARSFARKVNGSPGGIISQIKFRCGLSS